MKNNRAGVAACLALSVPVVLSVTTGCAVNGAPPGPDGFLTTVGVNLDEAAQKALVEKARRPLVIIGTTTYLPPESCVDPREFGGATEARRLGGDSEQRGLGGDTESRRLGGDSETRRLGGDAENRRLGGDTEGRGLGGDTEGRGLGGDTEGRRLGGDTEGRGLGGNTESRNLAGARSDIGCRRTPRGFAVMFRGEARFFDGYRYSSSDNLFSY